jgi:hypothetical protein
LHDLLYFAVRKPHAAGFAERRIERLFYTPPGLNVARFQINGGDEVPLALTGVDRFFPF